MRQAIGVLGIVASLLLSSCNGKDAEPSAKETTSTSVTSTTTSAGATPTTSPDVYRCSDLRSSPGRFDSQSGQYAVYLTGLDVARRAISFDVIQFLGGDEAAGAYHRDYPDDPEGPPNDYYIVNDNPATRHASVTADLRVRLVRLHQDGSADLNAGTFDELPTYLADYRPPEGGRLSSNPFWLTFKAGAITDLCEQYVP